MKSESRVKEFYEKGTKDWEAEYNMLLDDGINCSDCSHVSRCQALFDQNTGSDKCQFHPNRFNQTKK